MTRLIRLTILPASLFLLAACATQPPSTATSPEQVAIHESVASAPPRYETIKRLWVGSWRTAFGVPTYSSREDALADFRQQAANLGGNGVINFGCYRLPGLFNSDTRLACNGTVVRFL